MSAASPPEAKPSNGNGNSSVPSWMDETLPLETRRELLEKALEEIRAAKTPAKPPANTPASDRAGRSGSATPPPDRSRPGKDRPKA